MGPTCGTNEAKPTAVARAETQAAVRFAAPKVGQYSQDKREEGIEA